MGLLGCDDMAFSPRRVDGRKGYPVTTPKTDAPTLQERRMDGYYIGFDYTGFPVVDKILGAVACAGKAYHHTDCWNDETEPYDDHTGSNPNEWIQNAADEAADALDAREATIAALVAGLESALERLNASLFENAEHAQAKDIIRAALAKAAALKGSSNAHK